MDLCQVATSWFCGQAVLLNSVCDHGQARFGFVTGKWGWQSSAMSLTCHVTELTEEYCESIWIYVNKCCTFPFGLIRPLLWLSLSLLHSHCCIEKMEIDLRYITLGIPALGIQNQQLPEKGEDVLSCHLPSPLSLPWCTTSLESSALILTTQGSNFLQACLFEDSQLSVTPAQGKGQKHMIWDFSFNGN